VNKLRALSVTGALVLSVLGTWAALRYGSPFRYVRALLVAAFVLALPSVLAYGKLWARRGRRYVASRRRDGGHGTTFVSEERDPESESALSAVATALAREDEYRDVRTEDFSDGEGLLVTHSGFHSSFVRRTEDGRLVVTGDSETTRSLARRIGDLRGVSMAERPNNPFFSPIPVRGAPRAFLSVLLIVALAVGVGSVAGAAYPVDSYNTLEKAVLVSYDARADFVPGVSRTDARLDKAAFMTDSLGEEAVEIRWEENESRFLVEDAEQALAISADVRTRLRETDSNSLNPAQAARVDRIETDLHEAERSVAEAITVRLENDTTGEYAPRLRSLRARLRRAAERPIRASDSASERRRDDRPSPWESKPAVLSYVIARQTTAIGWD
jgi:hypothetical protein